jgi:MFS family permease
MVGTTIEWYDFFIYGAAAALIFNKLFFPNLDPLSGVLAAFATYAVGFIGRPLGGIVFGHFGDKVGRKSMLLLTLLLMGVPTVLIGLPFLASILLLGVGWYIRVKVPESPDFEKVKAKAEEIKVPALQVFKNHPKQVLTIIIARAAENAWFYMASTFALAYTTTQLGIPRQDILFATICGAGAIMLMTPLCGHLSDKVGQRNMFMFGLLVLVLALYCYPFFSMLNTKDPVLVWTAIVLAIGVVFPIMYAPQAQLFARQFPAEIRYSGISISVQFAGVLGGGLAPMAATKLLSIGGGSPHLISAYILSMAAVAILCTCLMPRDRSFIQHKQYLPEAETR